MKKTAMILAFVFLLSCLFGEEPPTAPFLILETGAHTDTIWSISTDAQGRWFLTASGDKSARLWNSEGKLLRVFRVPIGYGQEGTLDACALSPDGNTIALGGYTGWSWDKSNSIYIFERRSGSLVRRLTGLGNAIFHLSFSSDGSMLACSLWGKNGIRMYETRRWNQVYADQDYESESHSIVFSNDGRYAGASSYDGFLRLYRLQPPRLIAKAPLRGGKRPYGLCFSPDGSLLACGFDDSSKVDVFAIAEGGLSFSFSSKNNDSDSGRIFGVAFSADGRSLAVGRSWNQANRYVVRVWSEAGRGPYRDLDVGAGNTITDLKGLPDGSFLVSTHEPVLSKLSPQGELSFRIKADIADYRDNSNCLRLSPDARVFAYAYERWGKRPATFDLTTRQIEQDRSGLTPPDTSSLPITDWNNKRIPKLKGNPLPIQKNEYSHALAVAPGASRFLLGTEWSLRCFDSSGKQIWRQSVPGIIRAVNVSADGKIGLAAYADGTIRFHRMIDGHELLAFFPHADGKRWVLWTPSGYYDCSAGGEDLIGWQVNNGKDAAADFFPVSRFRETYYRPDVVSLVLDTLDEAQALASADAATGKRQESASILDLRPPIVTIIAPDPGTVFSSERVTLRYRLRAPDDAPVAWVKVLVDGRPIEGESSLAILASANTEESIDLTLPGRDCTVSLIAENKNGSSEAKSVSLVWKGAAAAQNELAGKPKLYVLAVGVSAYENPDYRLNYAAKDARDLATLLARGNSLYRGVETKVLADATADKNDILDGLDWIQKQTTSKDVAVIFFSGHGINDSTGHYYYLPVEADIDGLKRTGVAFSDIKTRVSSIAGKVLLFMDTCHTGELMAGRRATGAERDIGAVISELASAENGAIVFASSTGNQYSYEEPAWANGVFTKALIEGLGGAAGVGQGGPVTVNMLGLYLSERVKELTGGKQTPTTTKPPNVPDFPVTLIQ